MLKCINYTTEKRLLSRLNYTHFVNSEHEILRQNTFNIHTSLFEPLIAGLYASKQGAPECFSPIFATTGEGIQIIPTKDIQ